MIDIGIVEVVSDVVAFLFYFILTILILYYGAKKFFW